MNMNSRRREKSSYGGNFVVSKKYILRKNRKWMTQKDKYFSLEYISS